MSYKSTTSKYPPPDEIRERYNVKFRVHHIHDSNDPDYLYRSMFGESKYPPRYVTVCRIVNDKDETQGYGEALCSEKDFPNRKRGHYIAVSRAIKDFCEKRETALARMAVQNETGGC